MRRDHVNKLRMALFLFALSPYVQPQNSTPAIAGHAATTEAAAHKGSDLPTHGTINILLANKNGLVAVTDSLLSNDNGPAGEGQKLFRVDDHIICTIAGWYSGSGPIINPDVAGSPSYPAALNAPQLMQYLISGAGGTTERKMHLFSDGFAFALGILARIDENSGLTRQYQITELTVAGYDDEGKLAILQSDFIPHLQGGKIVQFDIIEKPIIHITEQSGFVSIFRGIDPVAVSIRDGSYPGMDSDPILGYLKAELATDAGDSISLSDLKLISKQIERLTAKKFPGKVGGHMQIAELTGGQISEFDQPIHALPNTTPYVYVWGEMDGEDSHGISLRAHSYMLSKGSKFHDGDRECRQELDNFFFFDSEFSRCLLTYSGEPGSIFDKSNKVVDSSLILFRGADPNSNFVKEFKANFPSVKITDQTGTPDPEKHSGFMIDVR